MQSGDTTSYTHERIGGTGVAGTVVYLYDSATLIGSTTVTQYGTWASNVLTFSNGTHYISATTVSGGVESALSNYWTFTVNTAPVTAPAPVITNVADANSDHTGTVSAGGTTTDTNPTVSGTGVAGDTVYLYQNGSGCGQTTVGSDGKWSIKISGALSTGVHDFTATQFGSGQSESAASNHWSVTVGSSTPTGPTIGVDGLYFADTGLKYGSSDRVNGPFVLKGTSTLADGSKIEIYTNYWTLDNNKNSNSGMAYATVSGGKWSLNINSSSKDTTGKPLIDYYQTNPGGITAFNAHISVAWTGWGMTFQGTSLGGYYGSTLASAALTDDSAHAVVSATHDTDSTSATHASDSHTTTTTAAVVNDHEAFVGKSGHDSVDLNVDPAAYFKESTAHIEGSTAHTVDPATGTPTGVNTLHLTGDHQILDLTSLTGKTAAAKISGIEVIDLGGQHNTLKLSLVDVLNLGEADLFQKDGKQQMMVNGKEGDEVDLSNSHIAGLAEGEWQAHGTTEVGGVTYNVYEHSGVHTELLVQQGVQIVVH
jgi:hypothetical protein